MPGACAGNIIYILSKLEESRDWIYLPEAPLALQVHREEY